MENQELDLVVPSFSDDITRTLSGGSRAFFSTPGRQGVIDQLLHLLQFGSGLPVIVGAAGAGKTALLNELLQHLSHLHQSVICTLSEGGDLAESLVLVCDALGVKQGERANPGEMLAALRHYGQALASEQKQSLLILDNAHLLDDATLSALASLLDGHDSAGYGLSILFSSRLGLVERLDAMPLLNVTLYDFEVPLLSSTELERFLEQFGYDESLASDDNSVRSIWSKSMGNPGVALHLLESDLQLVSTDVDADSPQTNATASLISGLPIGHIAAMVVLASVLAWAVMSRDEPAKSEPALAPKLQLNNAEVIEAASSPLDVDESSNVVAETEVKPAEPESLDFDMPTPARPDAIPSGIERSVENELVVGISSDEALSHRSDPVAIGQPSALKPDPESLVSQASEVQPEASRPLAPPTGAPTAYRHDESFLLSQPDSFYSLQVLAASKQDSLQAYISRQANQNNLYLYQGYRAGKSRYVVLAGVYTSRQAALRARDQLPDEQKSAGPWPRLLKEIKQEISANSRN